MPNLLETINTLQTELDNLRIIEKKSADASNVCSLVIDLGLAHLHYYDCYIVVKCSATDSKGEKRCIELHTAFLSEDENKRAEKSLFFSLSTFNAELLSAPNIQIEALTLHCHFQGFVELRTPKKPLHQNVFKQFSLSASNLKDLNTKADEFDVFEMFFRVVEGLTPQPKQISEKQLSNWCQTNTDNEISTDYEKVKTFLKERSMLKVK